LFARVLVLAAQHLSSRETILLSLVKVIVTIDAAWLPKVNHISLEREENKMKGQHTRISTTAVVEGKEQWSKDSDVAEANSDA
jgi:hypothetical protein